jgi:hypothetical protein
MNTNNTTTIAFLGKFVLLKSSKTRPNTNLIIRDKNTKPTITNAQLPTKRTSL